MSKHTEYVLLNEKGEVVRVQSKLKKTLVFATCCVIFPIVNFVPIVERLLFCLLALIIGGCIGMALNTMFWILVHVSLNPHLLIKM